MELGLTLPLQRHLKRGPLPGGREPDGSFRWDLHIIPLRGRPSLLAVHCRSRYALVLFELSRRAWERLEDTFRDGLGRSLAAAGLPPEAVADYLRRSGAVRMTKTHGRREVAFLNRAWDDVAALDYALDPTAREQPLLEHAVNGKPSRCAGYEGLAPAAERLGRSLLEEGGRCGL